MDENKIIITINANGAAFEENPELEIARILADLADKIRVGRGPEKLLDINGNKVGTVKYE
jgi:hypothetical protein